MTDGEHIEKRLLSAVNDELGVDAQPGDSLDRLGVDSLRLAEFVLELEKSFGFRADQDIFEVETLSELARYIEERGGR